VGILRFANTLVGIAQDPIGVHGLLGLAGIGEIVNIFNYFQNLWGCENLAGLTNLFLSKVKMR
jgi:hypothetical protein